MRAIPKVLGLSTMVVAHVIAGTVAASGVSEVASSDNVIVAENSLPGSSDWQLYRPGFQLSQDTGDGVLGYAHAMGVSQGGVLTVSVSVSSPRSYSVEFFRMGYYQGLGGRRVLSAGPFSGITQPSCPIDLGTNGTNGTGLIECRWSPSFTVTIPSNWTSGYYIAVLTDEFKYQSHVTFIVKDQRKAAIHFQVPEYTHAAYSNYPNDGITGKGLYDSNSYGPNTIAGTRRAVKVSLDRPRSLSWYGGGYPGGGLWEVYLVQWLEKNGYDVTYAPQSETQDNPERLKDASVVISPGHDEYWTREMRDAFESARDAGVSLMFLGANHAYWQGRLESSHDGRPNRVFTVYRTASIDPEPEATKKTLLFRSSEVGRPEQTLIGSQFIGFGSNNPISNTDYVITNPASWVYAGTGLSAGDTISRIVGWEVDAVHPVATPAHVAGTYEILSSSPYTTYQGVVNSNATIYQAPSGAWVFSVGTMTWSWGLDRPGYTDARAQTITRNVLNRMGVYGSGIAMTPTSTALPTNTSSPGSATSTRTPVASPTQPNTPQPTLRATPTLVASTTQPTPTVNTTALATQTPNSSVTVMAGNSVKVRLPIVFGDEKP